jgi:hypothetical protein
MEFEETNHQEVAEPDQAGSRAACVGLKTESKTGSVDYGTMEDSGEFFSYEGFKRLQESRKNPDGFTKSLNAREKTRKKDRIVLGMGVLDNSRRQPVPPGSTLSTVAGAREPAEWTGKPEPAGSTGTLQPAGTARIEQPAAPDTEPDDTQLDLIFALCERQERVSERLNRKVERLDQKLTARFDKKFELMDRKLVVLENRKVRE